jgi:predicted phosphoribosyltransferase
MANIWGDFQDRSLRNNTVIFKDRAEAGKRLAKNLPKFISPDALVLAIPAGGVPVAGEIARTLKLPLDLMIVRKIPIPGNTEAGFGAVGLEGEVIFNEGLLRRQLTEEARQVAATQRS